MHINGQERIQGQKYPARKYELIFEWALWGWYTDENYYPKNRTWKMFNDWLSIEVNSEIFDLVKGAIEKEEV